VLSSDKMKPLHISGTFGDDFLNLKFVTSGLAGELQYSGLQMYHVLRILTFSCEDVTLFMANDSTHYPNLKLNLPDACKHMTDTWTALGTPPE
jgi:hypothetical protein